jgi:methionyl-tRNA formyltransferase
MKIEFLTDDNPLYVFPFFEEFVRRYVGEFDVLQVSACRPMGRRSRRSLLRELFYLYGSAGFVKLAANMATARLLGRLPLGRHSSRLYTIQQLCRAYGIPYRRVPNPNSPEFVREVADRGADLIVSVACPYILKEPILRVPRLGCINIHNARLPKYKGMMPTFWQMFHGETEIGISIHYMTPAIDQGQILLQRSLKIEPGESLDHVMRRAKRFGASCMAQVLRDLVAETQSVITVDDRQGNYFTFPTIEQIREFRRRGFRAN